MIIIKIEFWIHKLTSFHYDVCSFKDLSESHLKLEQTTKLRVHVIYLLFTPFLFRDTHNSEVLHQSHLAGFTFGLLSPPSPQIQILISSGEILLSMDWVLSHRTQLFCIFGLHFSVHIVLDFNCRQCQWIHLCHVVYLLNFNIQMRCQNIFVSVHRILLPFQHWR